MPWDTNKFVTLECRLCSPIRTLDEIVTGANERCDGVDIALLTAPIELYNLYNIQNLIQAKITALIPLFVNHTLPLATPGNYDGESTIPMFTEATILVAIGAVSRLVPNRLLVDREWAVQQYKIINMLRYSVNIGQWNNNNTGTIQGTSDFKATISLAVADALAKQSATPIVQPPPFNNHNSYECNYLIQNNSGTYRCRFGFECAFMRGAVSLATLAYNPGIDVYVKIVQDVGNTFDSGNSGKPVSRCIKLLTNTYGTGDYQTGYIYPTTRMPIPFLATASAFMTNAPGKGNPGVGNTDEYGFGITQIFAGNYFPFVTKIDYEYRDW